MTRTTMSETKRARLVAASPVVVGDVVADKYTVEGLIAAGGMGVVVQARHQVLGHKLAIKFLIPEAMEEQTAARFLREAKAAARIQSERVVRVYDCGTLPSGVPYMVMEYLEGIELAQVIRQGGAMDVADAVDVIASTLEGVAEAHALGIVHRDLKPANLFLKGGFQRPYDVKVLDFGISKIQRGPDTPVDDELTGTSMLLGSPRYISPEQARSSAEVDVRADIWSVGVVLYEMLDGRCPFSGDTIGEVLSKILLHTPDPLASKRDDVPEGLARIISSCLERDRDERYRNVAELANALAPHGTTHAELHAERIGVILGVKPDTAEPSAPGVESSDEAVATDEAAAAEIAESTAGAESPAAGDGTGADALTPQPGQLTEQTWSRSGTIHRSSRTRLALLLALPALVLGGAAAWYLLGAERDAGATADPAHPVDGASTLATSAEPSSTGEPPAGPAASTRSEPSAQPSVDAGADADGPPPTAVGRPSPAVPRATTTKTRPGGRPSSVTKPPTTDNILGQSD